MTGAIDKTRAWPALSLLLGAVLFAAACGGDARPARSPTPLPVAPTATTVPTPGPLRPFTLPRAGGGTFALSDYLGKQPLNVVVYRGFF